MNNVGYALRMARQYYEKEGYNHALRVAGYVSENLLIPDDKLDTCVALAIMHDLLEDTDYICGGCLSVHFSDCLELLSKSKEESYGTYIERIKSQSDRYPEAYWVKLADMKDHLAQRDTLTEKLRDKYLTALPELL